MLTALDGTKLDEYVRQPGVTILDWRHPKNTWSVACDRVLQRASDVHQDVRFGAVDVSRHPDLAVEWNVEQIPTLMGYRDGVLVFSRPGALPEQAVSALIEAMWSLDIDEVKRGMDGTRTMLAFRDGQQPLFETVSVARDA
jgi:thioredoxin 1